MSDPDRIVRLDLSEHECALVSLAVAFYIAALVYGRGAFDAMLAGARERSPGRARGSAAAARVVARIEKAMKQ